MKNKEDIDVQSTYHEVDIKDTGEYSGDTSGRLVKNRGPITAKITSRGSHNRYCKGGESVVGDDCSVNFSLVAWKFAGDAGTVHGMIEEHYKDGTEGLKVDVDCLLRNENEAIVGGNVKEAASNHPVGKVSGRRAYVKVVDGTADNSGGDYVSNIYFDDGINSYCSSPGMDDKFVVSGKDNVMEARVSICSKHGDWEKCLANAQDEQGRAIE